MSEQLGRMAFFMDIERGVERHDLFLFPTASECKQALMRFFDEANARNLDAVISSAKRTVTIGNSDARFAVTYQGISLQYKGKLPPVTHVHNTHILRDYADRERFKDMVQS